MDKCQLNYRVTLKIYREAMRYAMIVRNKNIFRVGFVAVVGTIIYVLCALEGVVELDMLFVCIGGAYLLYMLFLLAHEDRKVMQYIKSDDSLLYTEYRLTFDEHKLTVDVPEKRIHNTVSMEHLASAVEISHLFMLNITAEQCYLVPTAAMTGEQREQLRAVLKRNLAGRFYSRFLK